MFGGKENDIRCDLSFIIQIQYAVGSLAKEVTEAEYNQPAGYWKAKYPYAVKIYRIWGQDPNMYVTKEQVV